MYFIYSYQQKYQVEISVWNFLIDWLLKNENFKSPSLSLYICIKKSMNFYFAWNIFIGLHSSLFPSTSLSKQQQ